MRLLALVPCVALLCIGCGPARFDASTDASCKASVDAMASGMPEAEKQQFVRDCTTIAMLDALPKMMKSAMAGGLAGAGPPPAASSPSAMFKPLQGLTVAEIRAKARALRDKLPPRPKPKAVGPG